MYKDNKNGKIGIIVTVIVLICLVIITNLDNNILSKIVNPFTKITMSAQSGVAYLKINYLKITSILLHKMS